MAIRLYWVLNIFWYTSILFEKPSLKPQPCTVVRLYSVLNVSCTHLTYWKKNLTEVSARPKLSSGCTQC